MFKLPLTGSKIRSYLGDLSSIVEILNPNQFHLLKTIEDQYQETINSFPSNATEVYVICYDKDNKDRVLIEVSKTKPVKVVWNFGNSKV